MVDKYPAYFTVFMDPQDINIFITPLTTDYLIIINVINSMLISSKVINFLDYFQLKLCETSSKEMNNIYHPSNYL